MERFIKNLARGAGAILREGFYSEESHEVSFKSEKYWDVVTKSDLHADDYIVSRIEKKYPSHGIISEENGRYKKKKHFWIIDPLDGTFPFVQGYAQFCTCITYVYNDQIRMACAYDPIHDELFFAQKGKGAILNGKKIHVSPKDDLRDSRGAFKFAFNTEPSESKPFFSLAADNRIWMSGVDSTILSACFLACGRLEMIISKGLSPWDYAAGVFIAKEAGAKVTGFDGKPYKWNSKGVIAASPVVYKKILQEVKT